MSDLKALQKEAANAADTHTGEVDVNCAKSNEWFGFYYGYIYAKQKKQANDFDTRTEPVLPLQNVIKRGFWSTITSNAFWLGFAIGLLIVGLAMFL